MPTLRRGECSPATPTDTRRHTVSPTLTCTTRRGDASKRCGQVVATSVSTKRRLQLRQRAEGVLPRCRRRRHLPLQRPHRTQLRHHRVEPHRLLLVLLCLRTLGCLRAASARRACCVLQTPPPHAHRVTSRTHINIAHNAMMTSGAADLGRHRSGVHVVIVVQTGPRCRQSRGRVLAGHRRGRAKLSRLFHYLWLCTAASRVSQQAAAAADTQT